MIKKCIIILGFMNLFICSHAQQPKDTLYGNVKSVREKVVFLDESDQDIQFYAGDGDYDHFYFRNPKIARESFFDYWYYTPYVGYSNYYQEFDKERKTTKEIWYYKSGRIVDTYEYKYDKKGNLIQGKEISYDNHYSCKNYAYDNDDKIRSSLFYTSDAVSYTHLTLPTKRIV